MDEQVLRKILKFYKRIKRDPYTKVYAPLGESYRRVGLMEEARQSCEDGLKRFPRYLACREVLGKVYLRQNRLADARRQLEGVHRIIGDNLELSKALVKAYAKAGEREKCLALLEWITEKDPFDFEMRNIQTQLRKDGEIEELRREAVKEGKDPNNIDIFELAKRPAVLDITKIIEDVLPDVDVDHEKIAKATDNALDSLENIESEFDDRADFLLSDADASRPVPGAGTSSGGGMRDLLLRREFLAESASQLSAAALAAQIELEISMLEEAATICFRMLEEDPNDEELQELMDLFDHHLAEKEKELERLEDGELLAE